MLNALLPLVYSTSGLVYKHTLYWLLHLFS